MKTSKVAENTMFVCSKFIQMRFPTAGHREALDAAGPCVLPGLCRAERFWEITLQDRLCHVDGSGQLVA